MNLIKTVCVRAAILCLFFVSTQSFANDKKVQAISPVSVKFLGVVDYKPVVQVEIDNASDEELFFVLKDETGNVLFTDKITEKKYSKKFQFSELEANNMNLTINLASKNSKKTEVFNVSNVTTIVEDVVVTRVR